MTELNDTMKASATMTLADANVSTPFKLYGWEITEFPPKILKQGGYRSSPTSPTKVAHSSTKLFPTGVIKAGVPFGTTDGGVTFVNMAGDIISGQTPDGVGYWNFPANSTISFNIITPVNETIKLQLDAASATLPNEPGTANSNFNLWINGKAFSQGTTPDTDPNWHPIEWSIDNGWLQAATPANLLKLEVLGTGLLVKSATFTSKDIPISASYYWKSYKPGMALPIKKGIYSVSVISGVTSSKSETKTFAVSLGLEVEDKMQLELDSVSAKLSTTFTTTDSKTHTISLSEQTEESYSLQIRTTPEDASVTYQAWQLYFSYESNGKTIEQAVPLSDAALSLRTFSTPLHPKKKS